MTNRIQKRRDTAANWTSANPVLASGEEAYETDTTNTKIGDGVTAWNSLGYRAPNAAQLNATYVLQAQKGAASGVATLDAGAKVPITQIPDLSATYALDARSLTPLAGQDRQLYAPGVLVFSPQFVQGNNAGEYVGVICIKTGANYKISTLWSDDDLATVILSDDILATAGTDFFDPFIIKIPNGDIIIGFHSGSGLSFYKSTNGGRTWTATSTLASTASNAYSEVCLIRMRQPGTGTPARLMCCFTDVDPTKARDTVVRTMFSDDETATWSASTVVTPTSGSSSCAQLSDNLRAWIYEDANANVQLLYTRKATGSPAEVWAENLNNIGQAPSGAPVKVAVATLATSTAGTPQNGVSPSAVRGRGGKYILMYSAANYGSGGSSGELHMIVGDGTKAGWTGADTVIASTTSAPGGYGRITPQRLSGGTRLEGLYVYVSGGASTLRSVQVING